MGQPGWPGQVFARPNNASRSPRCWWATATIVTFTAESLFAWAQGAGEQVSLATVYNTLKAFSDAGLVQEMTVDGSKSYFDTNTHDHPHFYWEDEHRLSDAPADQLQITRLPDAPDGAEVVSVDVVIRLRRRAAQ